MTRYSSLIVRLVGLCVARAWVVVALGSMLGVAMTYYVMGHFAMTTDTDALLSPKLPWRMRQAAFDAAFPSLGSDIVVVVDGQTPELSQAAAASLAQLVLRDDTNVSLGPSSQIVLSCSCGIAAPESLMSTR